MPREQESTIYTTAMTFDISGRSVRWPDGSDGTIQQESFDREGSGPAMPMSSGSASSVPAYRTLPEVCVSRLPLMSECLAATTKKRPRR